MNKIEAYLLEAVKKVNLEDQVFYYNPTLSELNTLVNKFDSLRGLFTRKDFIVWSAWEMTHGTAQAELDLFGISLIDIFVYNRHKPDIEEEWDVDSDYVKKYCPNKTALYFKDIVIVVTNLKRSKEINNPVFNKLESKAAYK